MLDTVSQRKGLNKSSNMVTKSVDPKSWKKFRSYRLKVTKVPKNFEDASSKPVREEPQRFPLLGLTREDTKLFEKSRQRIRQPLMNSGGALISPDRQSSRSPKSNKSRYQLLNSSKQNKDHTLQDHRENSHFLPSLDTPYDSNAAILAVELANSPVAASNSILRDSKPVSCSLPNLDMSRTFLDRNTPYDIPRSDTLSGSRMRIGLAREKTMFPSRYGYHERSRSPTYQRLDRVRRKLDTCIDNQVRFVVSCYQANQIHNKTEQFSDFYHKLLWREVETNCKKNTFLTPKRLPLGPGKPYPKTTIKMLFNVAPQVYLPHIDQDDQSRVVDSWPLYGRKKLSVMIPKVSYVNDEHDNLSQVSRNGDSDSETG